MTGVETFNAVLFAAMATALILALVSDGLQNRFIASEPLLALGCGALAGPAGLGWIRLEHLTTDVHLLLEQAARLTLSVAILNATLRVGWPWTRRNLRDIVLVLALGMPIMWGLSWVTLTATLGLSAGPSLLLAAIITPTDPVLAQSAVTSASAERNVPEPLRHLISIESVANDGLALPFVMMPILAMLGGSRQFAAGLLHVILWQVAGALALGAACGWLVGCALRRLGEGWTTQAGEITVSATLAFSTLAGARLLGMDGLFGVFGAGLGLAAALGKQVSAHHEFNETMARLFHLPMLTLLGLALPLASWQRIGWPLLWAALSILLLRRLPMALLLKPLLRDVRGWPAAVFLGWFGPIGIAALLYSVIAVRRTGVEEYFGVTTAVIVSSVVAYGLTDTVGARWLGRRKEVEGAPAQPASAARHE